MVLRYDNKKLIGSFAVMAAFILSMMSATLLTVWLVGISVFYVATENVKGALKALVFIQVRSLLSSGVSVAINTASNVKWVCLFLLSIYILLSCFTKIDAKLNKIILLLFLFFIYISFSALFVSSFPVVAVAKAVSYILPFAAILCGVQCTSDFDWIGYFNKILGSTLFLSSVLLPFPFGYIVNGHAFQGALNHPNMYGIMLAVFLAGYLYKRKDNIKPIDFFVIFFVLFLIFQTESRTALISAVTVLAVHFLFSRISSGIKVLIIIFGLVFLLISFELPFFDYFTDFIYKGNDDIWYSRNDLIESNMARFNYSPFFGTGFNVPFYKNYQTYQFSFDMIVENGNFVTALLGDLGVVGSALFIILYGYIFKKGNKRNMVLFVVPFLISMGEMVFFSSNNCALVLYFYFAVYLVSQEGKNSAISNLISHCKT